MFWNGRTTVLKRRLKKTMRQTIELPRAEAGCPEMISAFSVALNLSRIHIQIFSVSDALHIKQTLFCEMFGGFLHICQ
jgi:hypothetical protein